MKELDSFTVEQLNDFIESDHAQCGDVAALATELLSLRKQLDDMREFALAIKALQNMRPSESFLSEMKDLRKKIDKEQSELSVEDIIQPWPMPGSSIFDAILAGKVPGVVIEKKRRKIKVTFDKLFSEDKSDINIMYSIAVGGEIIINDSIKGSLSAPRSKTYDVEDFDVIGSIHIDLLSVNKSLIYNAEWVN